MMVVLSSRGPLIRCTRPRRPSCRLALLALIAACSRATILDFEFQGAGGHPVYRSGNLGKALEREFTSGLEPIVVLVETPSYDDARYSQQMGLLESLDAEDSQLLFVTACPCGPSASGYSTTAETANRIAGGEPRFRVTVLDGEGVVLKESDTVLPASEVATTRRR